MDKFLLTSLNFNKDDFLPLKKYFSSETAYYTFLEMIKEDKKILISKVKRIRSEEQNAYYWGGVIPFIHALKPFAFLAEKNLNDKVKDPNSERIFTVSELYHEMLKHEFNGIRVPSREGKLKHIGVNTATLNTQQFGDYILRIGNWVSENFGMPIPTPEDYEKWLMQSGLDDTNFIQDYINKNKYPDPEDFDIDLTQTPF